MKKKILIGIGMVAFLFIAQAGFAQDFEIGGTFMHYSSIGTNSASLVGGGLNIGATTYFGDTVGMGAYGNILYAPYNSLVSVMVFDILLGVSFMIVDNEYFSLPFSFGAYFEDFYAFSPIATREGFNIGVGGNLTGKFKVSEAVKVYLRFQAAYTFLGGGEVFITPSIGLAF
ncbi:MAG: hypothetical protein LBT01_08615 [Spirochaetaceae bacterium]|nr:hypothetical protein [Spirochaetaceae bacterium]